jgi:hypothetical protein
MLFLNVLAIFKMILQRIRACIFTLFCKLAGEQIFANSFNNQSFQLNLSLALIKDYLFIKQEQGPLDNNNDIYKTTDTLNLERFTKAKNCIRFKNQETLS